MEVNVKFVGTLKHDAIFQFLDEIDVYIHPSKTEGLPRAIVEAFSRGLPTLGAKSGGIPELIGKEYLFGKGAEDEIEQMLLNIDKGKMKEQAKRNFETSKKYTADKLNRERLDFYREFLTDHNLKVPSQLAEQIT